MVKHYLRNVIGEYMVELGRENTSVVLVNADLMGTCRNNTFVAAFPERSFNVGIAEQNMVSFSAGLAHEGFIPFAFSMAPFISMRACEQCRTDVAYGNLNVRLIATYAGYSGGVSGATHWGLEDCGIMCSIPQMAVVEPSDPTQAKALLHEMVLYQGPVYMRSSVEPVSDLYHDSDVFSIGKACTVRDGNDGAFLCAGVTVQFAAEASDDLLQQYGLHIRVVDLHTIKPIDRAAVISAAKTGNVIVAQDHSVFGGLGQQAATVIAEESQLTKFKILGCADQFIGMAHAGYLYHKYGFDAEGLKSSMLAMLGVADGRKFDA